MPKVEGCGRKQSTEWTMVNRTTKSHQVTCKYCSVLISAKVERIRSHMNKCPNKQSVSGAFCSSSNDVDKPSVSGEMSVLQKRNAENMSSDQPIDTENTEVPRTKHQRSMGEFAIKTNDVQKKNLDKKISEFFYANNIAFTVADSNAFKDMVCALRPGYIPPNRKKIAGPLLDEAEKSVDVQMEMQLKDSTITLMLDGWSNTSADPIIAVSIHTGESTYLLDAIDCQSEKKTAKFCAQIAINVIADIKQKYGKNVFAVCCDNENKMKKFRSIMVQEHPYILAYGCSAHYMNLLAKEITPQSIMKYIIEVQKFFRHHNRPLGWLLEKQGQRPKLPNETRWSSEEACLSSFVANYQKYVEISVEHTKEIEKNILTYLDNKGLYRESVHLLAQLAIVAKALDNLQRDDCTLAKTVEIWLNVLESEELSSHTDAIKERFEQAVMPFHFLATITDPALKGKRLTKEQEASAEKWVEKWHPNFDIPLKLFQIQDKEYYPESMFSQNTIESFSAKKWWKVMRYKAVKNENLDEKFCEFMEQLHSITSTSASIERIFSTFGLVWSKLRNSLGCEKAKKLVKVYKSLRSKGVIVK